LKPASLKMRTRFFREAYMHGCTAIPVGLSPAWVAGAARPHCADQAWAGGCSNVTNAGLQELRDLTALTWLSICTKLTDTGLQELRQLTALTTLDLYGRTSDAGLQHLSSLTALTTLIFDNTSTTQAGRNALKTALPALTIRW